MTHDEKLMEILEKVTANFGPIYTLSQAIADINTLFEVCALRLCETKFLHLHPDQLYFFTVDEECDSCQKAASNAKGDEP